MKGAIIIPARLGSVRFPRKLLAEVRGEPLILWTARRISELAPDLPLVFAVAEVELQKVVEAAGYPAVLTDADLPSGTDRIAVANRQIQADWVINVQADEPVIPADAVERLRIQLESGAQVVTAATRFANDAEFQELHRVKVVVASSGNALYFSRATIPCNRDAPGTVSPRSLWHLGVYGYSAKALEAFSQWEASPLESLERLEQLRFLENGFPILVEQIQQRSIGVDTPADLEELRQWLSRASPSSD